MHVVIENQDFLNSVDFQRGAEKLKDRSRDFGAKRKSLDIGCCQLCRKLGVLSGIFKVVNFVQNSAFIWHFSSQRREKCHLKSSKVQSETITEEKLCI